MSPIIRTTLLATEGISQVLLEPCLDQVFTVLGLYCRKAPGPSPDFDQVLTLSYFDIPTKFV